MSLELTQTALINDPRLKLYNRFESGAETLDSSGNGNTLTAVGVPVQATPRWGTGCAGLGTTQAFSAVNHADFRPAGNFSISSWVRTTKAVTNQTIFTSFSANTNYAGIQLRIDNANKVRLYSGKNTGTVNGTNYKIAQGSVATLCDGVWHQVVATYDGTKLHLYVDGAEDGTGTAWTNAAVFAATNYVLVGAESDSGANQIYFQGLLDEVCFYPSNALSLSEVQSLYAASITAASNSAILAKAKAVYLFEDGALLTDSTANAHTLTAISTPTCCTSKFGGSVFLGNTSYYTVTDVSNLKPTGPFTVYGWIKSSNIGATQNILQSYSANTSVAGFYWSINSSNKIRMTIGKNTGTASPADYSQINGSTTVTDGLWHFVVVNWDGAYINLYVDGNSDATSVACSYAPAYAATNYVRVGVSNLTGSNTNPFLGQLDEISLINGAALSANQVLDIYTPTLPTVTTDSVTPAMITATATGSVADDGGPIITERGVVISTKANPTILNTKSSVVGTTGSFTTAFSNLIPSTTYHARAYATNLLGTAYGSDIQTITLYQALISKKFYYKIYDVNGNYVATWSKDVISDPNFRTVINGGGGELKIQLARKYDNFGEGIDVSLQNRVEVWVVDKDNIANNISPDSFWDTISWDLDLWDSAVQSFAKIYTGYISAYAPVLEDEMQRIDVTVLGFTSEATKRIVRDSSGNTTLTYNSYDPAAIMKDVIGKYRADGGTNINYIGASIGLTGTTVSYTFQDNTLKECFDKIIELCPEGWYWYMDANGAIFLKNQSATADHVLTIGKDLNMMDTDKRIENLANVVYLIGGGTPPLYRRYSRDTSINTYGKFEVKINDGRVTDTVTADIMAKSYLDTHDTPETRTVLQIVDNNGNNNEGQNIEAFYPGDTIQIKNLNYGPKSFSMWDTFQWDTDVWDAPIQYTNADVMVIVSVDYQPDYIKIEASSRLPEVTKRIEDIKRNMDTLYQSGLPSSPTSTSI